MLLLLICSLTTLSQEPRWEIVSRYYSDEDRTVVMLRKMPYGERFSPCYDLLLAEFSYKGREPQPPERVSLGFITNRLRECEVVIMADGERFDLGQLDEHVNMHQGNECEALIRIYAVSIRPEVFRKIVAAKKIQVSVGGTILPLGEEHFEALRDLASRMRY